MTKPHNKKSGPSPYMAKSLSGKSFAYPADVHIQGDINLDGQLIVGGDLVVDGNLTATEILCFGSITVKGNIDASTLCVGFSVTAGGAIDVGQITNGFTPESFPSRIESIVFEIDTSVDDWQNEFVHPAVAEEQEEKWDSEGSYPEPAVQSGGNITCFGIEVWGYVDVGGYIDADIAVIHGSLNAREVIAQEELRVDGAIDTSGNILGDEIVAASGITCNGRCHATELTIEDGDILVREHLSVDSDLLVRGNIQAGKGIAVGGRIKSEKFIKAGEFIVGEGGIQTGEDYGIFAGLCLPRSRWQSGGYVSSKRRPRNILTGKFVAGIDYQALMDSIRDAEKRKADANS